MGGNQSSQEGEDQPTSATQNVARDPFSAGVCSFTVSVLKELVEIQSDRNVFFSAFSLYSAMAMTASGAKGETENEILTTLKLPFRGEEAHIEISKTLESSGLFSKSSGPIQLSLANKIWVEKTFPLEQKFIELTTKYYNSPPESADFVHEADQARIRINQWVEEQTANKIQDLIAPGIIDAGTSIILANAIYFKGNWANSFLPEKTTKGEFSLLSGAKVEAAFMNETGRILYTEQPEFEAIEKPYASAQTLETEQSETTSDQENSGLSMIFILPREKGLGGIRKVLKKLIPEGPNSLPSFLNEFDSTQISVQIPKFKVEFSFQAKPVLEKLGIKEAFTASANFSGISSQSSCISAVIHQAFVEVNEEGTEAAAATAVEMTKSKSSAKPRIFKADRPFFILIWDRTSQLVLFSGLINHPTK